MWPPLFSTLREVADPLGCPTSLSLRCGFFIEFAFGGFAAFGDEVVAGFAAEKGDRLAFVESADDAIEAAGFVVFEWCVIVELPQDAAGTVVGRPADLGDKLLRARVADGAGIAVHAGLAIEFVAQVFDFERAVAACEIDGNAGWIELVEREAKVLVVVNGHHPATLEVDLGFDESVLAVFGMDGERARIGGSIVNLKAAEIVHGRLGGIAMVAENAVMPMQAGEDFNFADAVNARFDEITELVGDGHGEGRDGGSNRDRGSMDEVKVVDLVEDDIGDQPFGPDGGTVIKRFATQVMRVVAEDFALAGSRSDFGFNAEQHRDVLIRVKSIGDEERDDDDRGRGREFVPFGDERGFLHVGIGDGGITSARGRNLVDLIANRFGRILIEARAVAGDDERGLRWIDLWCDFLGATQDEASHRRMHADG